MKGYIKAPLIVLMLILAALIVNNLQSQPTRAAGPLYVKPGGSDSNDCLGSTTACATINGALNKPGFVAGDSILVATGVYTGTGTEVVLLNKSTTLSGGWDAGFIIQSGTSIIDGQGARRGITVNSGVTAIMERFAVQNGSASDGGGILNAGTLTLHNSAVSDNTSTFFGGGIWSNATLTLDDSIVSGNETSSSTGGSGGGIWNSGTLTLSSSIVSNNISGWNSGGIYNRRSLTMNNSAVNGNTARTIGGVNNDATYGGGTAILNKSTVNSNTASSNGGGISNSGVMTLNNSTVSGNIASGDNADHGGGIYNGGTMTLNNSTVSDNRLVNPSQSITDRGGGGISSLGTFNLNNSTISGNSCSNLSCAGGGLYNFYGGPYGNNYMTLQNTIVAGNAASSGPDCTGYVNSAGYNLIGDTLDCTFSASASDLLNVTPRLFPLTGSPAYHPLLPGSPAIDAGNPAGCTDSLGNPLTTDQRGVSRTGRCDIGAYEFDPNNDPLTYIYLPVVLRQ